MLYLPKIFIGSPLRIEQRQTPFGVWGIPGKA